MRKLMFELLSDELAQVVREGRVMGNYFVGNSICKDLNRNVEGF